MLPHSYELPAAVALILGGVLTCFAGYRLFRIVVGIYGFILGAVIASSMMGINNPPLMIAAALVGGVVGALLLIFAYVVGVALAGGAVGLSLGHLLWPRFGTGDPPATALIVVAVAGALGAMLLRRYVLIVATAFGGAWTIVIGVVNALATREVSRGLTTPDIWILYPTTLPAQRWAPVVWLVLSLVGSGVQLSMTGGRRKF